MLESYPMVAKDGLLIYPEEIRERFLETGPLPLRDGTAVAAEEIWRFMTEEGPARFPYCFTSKRDSPWRLPFHVDLLSGIKLHYLFFSSRFRVENLRRQGKPLIFVQGGQTLEPYYAAESIPLRPGELMQLAFYYLAEGMNVRDKDWKLMDLQGEGTRTVSMETCHQMVAHTAVRTGVVPVALMGPCTRSRCSDITFLVESHRDSPMKTPCLLVDYPVNYEPHKTWMVEYVATGVRRLISAIDGLTGRTTTEEDLRAQLALHNRVRRLAREIISLWTSAEVPPASSIFAYRTLALGKDCDGDPVAAEHVLCQMRDELRERVEKSVKGFGLATRPVRIFKCGSCFYPNLHRMDDAGGMLIGGDDWWSDIWMPDVDEEGDPFEAFARGTLAAPYELASEQRAHWVVDQIKESRAEGLIFGYQWGCNFQSAIAQMTCDIAQKESGVPSMTLAVDSLGRGESIEQADNRIEAFIEMLAS